MTPKQVDIIKAAIELIAEKGYYNTSTSEIAKRAGVAEGTIFRHYKTKKDLLVAIVTPVITEVSAPLFAEKLVEQVFSKTYGSLEELLYAFIKNRVEFARANLPLIKILLQELAFHPEIQENYKQTFSRNIQPALDQTIDFFKQKREIDPTLPNEAVIRMTITAVLGLIITRFMIQPDKEWDEEVEIKRTTDFIVKGLRGSGLPS
nr:TetR/AcrR family transcriptional regulator [Lentibacillus saliphilus]